jgi:hypothetical protein
LCADCVDIAEIKGAEAGGCMRTAWRRLQINEGYMKSELEIKELETEESLKAAIGKQSPRRRSSQ